MMDISHVSNLSPSLPTSVGDAGSHVTAFLAMAPSQAPSSVVSGDGASGVAGAEQTTGGGMQTMFFMMFVLFGVMILLSVLGGRKEKKKRAALLGSIARHDRVRTAGGVIGTIVEVKNDEVVLKVDESTNTRITFDKASIQSVIKKAKEAATASSDEMQDEPEVVESH